MWGFLNPTAGSLLASSSAFDVLESEEGSEVGLFSLFCFAISLTLTSIFDRTETDEELDGLGSGLLTTRNPLFLDSLRSWIKLQSSPNGQVLAPLW